MRRLVAPVAGASAVLLLGVIVPWTQFGDRVDLGDVKHYRAIALRILDGGIPYHQFFVEYPPAALGLFLLPTAVTDSVGAYGIVFRCSIVVAALVAIVAVAATLDVLGADRRRLFLATALVGATPVLLGPVFFERYDMWAAAVTAVAVLLVVLGREDAAAVTLGVGAATKVYPALLVPLLLLRVGRRRGSRAAVRCAALAAATFAVIVGPFAVIAPGGVGYSFKTQLTRVLELESLGAALLLAAHRLGVYAPTVYEGLSPQLVGRAADVAGIAQTICLAAALLAVYVAFSRGTASNEAFVASAAAAVALTVAFDKVLSPQYLVWLVPLVVLVGGRAGATASTLLVAALLLTLAYFPWSFHDLRHLGPTAWVVLARDLVLVAVAAVLAADVLLRRERGAEQLDRRVDVDA